jgi:hypothetical protein
MLVGLAAPARAEALNPRWIDADATWVLHIDLENLMQSEFGRHVLNDPDQFGMDDDDLQDFIRDTGIDPRQDMTGISVYGRGEPDEKAIVLITMNDAIDGLIEKMKGEPQYWEIKHKGHVFHGWMEGEDEGALIHVRPRRRGDRLVLVSGDIDALARAADVLDGKQADLRKARDAALQASPRDGSLVYAEAIEMPWLEDGENPASAIVRQMSRLVVDLGEDGEDSYLAVTVSADTSEDARNISEVLQGIVAMGRMIGGSEPELAPLLEISRGLQIQADGRHISIEARYRTGHLAHLLHQVAELEQHDDDDDDHDHDWDDDDDHDHDHDDDDDDDDDDDHWDRRDP